MASLQQIRDFFIGDNKYTVANRSQTPIYDRINGTILKYVDAGKTIGKVIDVNSSGQWGLLHGGGWIKFTDDMYTYIRTGGDVVVIDKAKEVAEKIGEGVSNVATGVFNTTKLLKYLMPVLIVGLLVYLVMFYTNKKFA